MPIKKLENYSYSVSQKERIASKLGKRLISLALDSIGNCSVKNLTFEEFQSQMSNSFVGLPQIQEFVFSDLTIRLLQDIGTEQLYNVYKAQNLDQKIGLQPTITRIRKAHLDTEQKSIEEFLISQEADRILELLRKINIQSWTKDVFWEIVNEQTVQNKKLRTKISVRVRAKMSALEIEFASKHHELFKSSFFGRCDILLQEAIKTLKQNKCLCCGKLINKCSKKVSL
jgi:hypothetical protein